MILVLCDENIAGADEYLKQHANVRLIKCAGRKMASYLRTQAVDALWIRSVMLICAKSLMGVKDLPKFIGTATLGVDHVDEAWLNNQGITFASATGSSCHSVAQYVVCAIYHLRPHIIRQPMGNQSLPTIGIIGLGHIGSALAVYAHDLGMHVLGYDPLLPSSSINNSTLDDLLKLSDVVSLHTPLTKHGAYPTFAMVDEDFLAQLKPSAMLINSARGEIICPQALTDDIHAHQRQVVLDVFPDEPIIDKSLLEVLSLATPHIAGYTLDAKLRGTDMIYRAFCRYFDLPVLCQFEDVLPSMPAPRWQTVQTIIKQGQSLVSLYDIAQDDANLRALCGHQVSQADFDGLRKHYRLRREWQ